MEGGLLVGSFITSDLDMCSDLGDGGVDWESGLQCGLYSFFDIFNNHICVRLRGYEWRNRERER